MTAIATANVFAHLDLDQAAHVLDQVLAERPDFGGLQEWARGRDRLLNAAKGYHHARGNHGGGPVFWKADRYSATHVRSITLARQSFVGRLVGRKSTLPDSVATEVVLHDDRTGRELAILNFHLDAEVQTGGRYRTDKAHRPRVRRHKREVRKITRRARHHRKHGRDFTALGDTNFTDLEIRGLTSCWKGRAGHTLGKRAVDVIYRDAEPLRVKTIPTASDHDAVVAIYKEF